VVVEKKGKNPWPQGMMDPPCQDFRHWKSYKKEIHIAGLKCSWTGEWGGTGGGDGGKKKNYSIDMWKMIGQANKKRK